MLNLTVDHTTFMTDYFEQQPLLCRNALAVNTMHWRTLDAVLQTLDPDPAVLQLFLHGQLEPGNYLRETFHMGRPRRVLDKFRFYELMRRGATLVLNRAEDYCAQASALATAIAKFSRQPTSSNAYVSFSGEGTFGAHWDTHDVFAVQWLGKKLWRLYEPTLSLPLSHQTSRRAQHTCPTTPSHEIVLEPGDLLYVPRGWWHQVVPLDTASWHLSVGTYPQNMTDYIMWVCGRELPQILAARRTFDDGENTAAALDEIMQALSSAVFNRTSRMEFMLSQRAKENPRPEFSTELFLVHPDSSIPESTMISLSSIYPPDPNTAEITTPNGRLRLSPASRAVMQYLHTSGGATWESLAATLLEIPTHALRETLLDLSRHDLVTLQPPTS